MDLVQCINGRDIAGILALVSEDHLFVDSLGGRVQGRTQLEQAWREFFRLCPDYAIAVETSIAEGDRVGLFGAAHGTIVAGGERAPWRAISAWLSMVQAGRVREWRVFADLKQLYEVLKER
jgi:ketosteroid isomerase-like protein